MKVIYVMKTTTFALRGRRQADVFCLFFFQFYGALKQVRGYVAVTVQAIQWYRVFPTKKIRIYFFLFLSEQ